MYSLNKKLPKSNMFEPFRYNILDIQVLEKLGHVQQYLMQQSPQQYSDFSKNDLQEVRGL